MSDQQKLIDRMTVAVEKAFKAISVLKSENKRLLDDNNKLMKRLQQYESNERVDVDGCISDIDTETNSFQSAVHIMDSNAAHEISNKPKTSTDSLVVSSHKRSRHEVPVIDNTFKDVVIHEHLCTELGHFDIEVGWDDSLWQQRSDSDQHDAKHICGWLKEDLRFGTIHAFSQILGTKFSPSVVGKALFVEITGCVDQSDVSGCWQDETTLAAAHHLVYPGLVERMDMLSGLFVSLATLTENGLLNVNQLLLTMKNLYIALARNALPSALYTILLADKSLKRTAASQSEDVGFSNTTHDDTEDTTDDSCETVDVSDAPMEVEANSQPVVTCVSDAFKSADRKSELYDMFGFGDDDDDDDDDKEQLSTEDKQELTNSENVNSTEQTALNKETVTKETSAIANSSLNHRQQQVKPFQRHILLDACKFYLLLRTTLRLGLSALLGDILSELLLSAAQDVSLGVPIALLEAFPLRQCSLDLSSDVCNSISLLCELWIELFSARLAVIDGDGALKNITREVLKRLESLRLAVSESSPLNIRSLVDFKRTDLSDLLSGKLDEASKRSDPTDEFRLRLNLAARQTGYLQSIITVSETRLSNSSQSKDHTEPNHRRKSDVLGLLNLEFLKSDAGAMIMLMRKSNLLETRRKGAVHGQDDGVTFTHLIEDSCRLSLESPAEDAGEDEEVFALSYFQRHWRRTLQSVNSNSEDMYCLLRDSIAILSSLMNSLLRSELSCGGWRTGHSGDGLTIESRLRNRMEVASDLMRKVPQLGWHSRGVQLSSRQTKHTQNKQASNSARWYRYCSVGHDEINHATAFLDHCITQTAIVSVNSTAAMDVTREEALSQQQAWSSISALAKDIAALVAASVVERSLFLAVSSMRALLPVLIGLESQTANCSMLSVMDEVIRFLLTIPGPWGAACGARSDIAHEIKTALYFRRKFSRQLNSPNSAALLSRITLNWIANVSRRIPAFVINLDRRTDRWRKFLLMNERLGVSFIRVRAVDGSSSTYTESDEDGASRSSASLVSESDVTSYWDSTLNNQFDSGCMINSHTPLTPAERACAASHLKVWRTIASIRSKLSLGAQGVKEDLVDYLGCSSSGSSGVGDAQSVYAAHRRTASSHLKQHSMSSVLLDAELDHYLVFEDDAAVSLAKQASFRKEVAYLMRKLPSDVDVLYLGGAVPKRAAAYKSTMRCNKLFYQVNYIWMLHAYVLRGRAVDVLLGNLPIHSPVDNFIASLIYSEQLKACLVAEEVVGQSQRTLKGRRHESDIRHSGRVTHQQEYASRSSVMAAVDKVRFAAPSNKASSHISRAEE